MGNPIRIGQAKVAKLKIYDNLPFQADGEPWVSTISILELQPTKSRIMLKNQVDDIFLGSDGKSEKSKLHNNLRYRMQKCELKRTNSKIDAIAETDDESGRKIWEFAGE